MFFFRKRISLFKDRIIMNRVALVKVDYLVLLAYQANVR